MEINFKRVLGLVLAFVMVFGMIPMSASAEGTAVAQIGETPYGSFADAIAAVQNGETIELLADCGENVTIKQAKNVSFTIDGNSNTYTGTITVDGASRHNGLETLTIQNVKFVAANPGQISIDTVKKTYVHNLTVKDCTFTGNDEVMAYGIVLRHVYNINVENCVGTKLYELIYGHNAITGIVVKNVEVTDSDVGIFLNYVNSTAVFENVTTKNCRVGVLIANNAIGKVTFDDCNLEAETNVHLRKIKSSEKSVSVTFIGHNVMTCTGDEWLVNENETCFPVVYDGDNGAADGDDVVDYEVVYTPAVAKIGTTRYETLAAALAAAKVGETVVLIQDTEEELVVVPADVKLDLRGNVVKASNVLSFGAIVDIASATGGIEISNDTTEAFVKLQPANGGYLPIYNGSMYKFYAYELKALSKAKDSTAAMFGIKLTFTNVEAYEALAAAENEVDLAIKFVWPGLPTGNGFDGIIYTMSDATVKDYAEAAAAAGVDHSKAMTVTLNGVDKLGNASIEATAILNTTAEVTAESATTYTVS